MNRMEGRKALVTGANGGIGQAIVTQLRREGAKVCVADIDCSGLQAEASLPGSLLDAAYTDSLCA